MTKEELIKRLETTCYGLDPVDPLRLLVDDVIAALAQPKKESVQVSPLDFVTMTLEKEHLVGKPIIWAEWPNKENT